METVLYISASVALLALAGLFIYLIRFIGSTRGLLGSVTTALQGIIDEIGALRSNLQGTIRNVEGITGKVEGTVDRLNDSMTRVNMQLDQVEGIVESVRVVAQDVSRVATDATDVVHEAKSVVVGVIGLADNVQNSVQKPVNELMTIFSALGIGIRRFRMKLAGAGSNGHAEHAGAVHADAGTEYMAGRHGLPSPDGAACEETIQVTHTTTVVADGEP